jgi:hypothetical protein
MSPPGERPVPSISQLLENLEQLERLIRQLALQVLPAAEETPGAWEIANRVCDRYRIPKAA